MEVKTAMYAGFPRNWKALGVRGAAEEAVRQGFRAVELIDIGDMREKALPTERALAELRDALWERGLTVCCFSSYADLSDDAGRKTTDRLIWDLAAAKFLGSPFFHHTVLPNVDPDRIEFSRSEALRFAVEKCLPVARCAESLGMRSLFEPQGLHLNGIECFGEFYEAMARHVSNLGVVGDTGNPFFADTDPGDFFEAFGDRICHVHVKDYEYCAPDASGTVYRSPGGRTFRAASIGMGSGDLRKCMRVLKARGYAGTYSFENEEADLAVGWRIGREFLQRELA